MIVVTADPACGLDNARVNAWCEQVDAQAFEMCKAHGVPYVPTAFMSSDVLMKLEGDELAAFVRDARLCTIQVDCGVPGALGFHDDLEGIIFIRITAQGDATSVTLSHEVLEELLDPTCEDYAPMGDGRSQAREACDRVEGDSYAVGGVALSNYLLPAAFEPGSAGPWDRLSVLTAWDGMSGGGYMIVRDADGNETQLFANTAHGEANAQRKKAKVGGRAFRRFDTNVSNLAAAAEPEMPAPPARKRRAR